MTNPALVPGVSEFAGQQVDNESDALDGMARVVTGNSNLVTRPGLVQALVQGNATTAQSAMANAFMGSLNAEQALAKIRLTGQRMPLPTAMKQQLDAVGADYSDVNLTPQQEAQKITAAGMVPVYNQGQLVGARAKTQQEQQKGQDGWFDSFGGFFHHLLHNPVTNVIGEAGNVVQAGFGNLTSSPLDLSNSVEAENQTLMRSMGYDPYSMTSRLAFAAKGYMRGDLTGTVNKYGQDAVTAAEGYLADPKQYVTQMLADANRQDPSGALAAQKMQQLNSQQFGDVLREVGGRQAGLGDDVAQKIGLDPIKNPGGWGWTSGGVNFVAALATDPTLLAGRVYKMAKVASVGINGAADTARMARILDPANVNPFARRVQNGFQFAVDQGNAIREGQAAMQAAQDAGDLAKYAQAEAQVGTGYANLKNVGLENLAPALLGHPVEGVDVLDKANPGLLKLQIGGEPLDTYDKLFDYVVHTNGMLALQTGRAFVESTLMPGAMSKFGATRLRAILNGTLQGRRTAFNLNRLEAATRLLPSPVDAVEASTGTVLADSAEAEQAAEAAGQGGLASQSRAATSTQTAFPSAEQLGEADYNLRRYGNFTGTGLGGLLGRPSFMVRGMEVTPGAWLNPKAIAARARLAATRLNIANVLPRNNEINLLDEQAPAKVYAFARTYLPVTQSSMLAASFAAGDVGARRAILTGLKTQVMHSAGLYHSEAGREFAEGVLKNDSEMYSHSVDGVMDQNPWNGELDYKAGIWAAQNRLTYSIPSFAQMHQLAAKIGLHEAMLGRLMQSRIVDGMSQALRTSMLLSPRTAVRATVEGWVNMLARGDAARALGAKAMLRGVDGGLPETTWLTKAITKFPPLRFISGYVHAAERRLLSPDEAEYLTRLADHPEIAHAVQDSMAQHLLKGDINPAAGTDDALDIARTGFQPALWQKDGFSLQSVDGYAGAQRLQAALELRQFGNPETFKALLEHIADPSEENRLRVLDALKTPDEYRAYRASEFGNVFLDENNVYQRALTEDEKELALHQHATRMENDLRHLLTTKGQQAEFDATGKLVTPPVDAALSEKLLAKLRGTEDTPGVVPDGDWIHQNLLDAERPESAIAPTWMAKVVDDKDNLLTAWQKIGNSVQDLSGKAYKMLVTRPAERMTSMPAFWGNYAKARVQMQDLEAKLIEDGHYDPETVDQLLMHRAIRQAWIRTEATVDDPGLKTQLDVVGRNFFAFPRAVNAFIRRYGQLVKQDPTVIRKAILGIQAAETGGVLYTDPNGELTYTFPGSSFLANSLNHLAQMVGLENLIQLPTGDMTGKLLMSAPGFDNPIRPSMSPMLNVPFRFIANMFPDHREMFSEIDSVLNGAKGAGRSWESELMPAALSHFVEALDPHEQNNMMASATIGAFSNMVAADPNGTKGIWVKPGSDPTGAETQRVLATLKTQVRNQLFMRAALGLIAPGALSRPEDNYDGTQADEAYYIRGARSLDDEYKMMLNDFGGDYAAAQQAFLTSHPNGLIYTMPTTTVLGTDKSVPATRASEQFFEQNYDLVQKYPNVLAYFAPASEGKFDANAWQSQLALGLRQKKSISDFVNSYELKQGQNGYFAAYDQYKAAKDAATRAGDKSRASFLASDFQQQMAPYLAANPLLQDWLAMGSAEKASIARKGVDQLRAMTGDPQAQNLPGIDTARQMLAAWDTHEQFQQNRVNNTSAARKQEDANFAEYMTGIVADNPNMTGLYAMFRALDNKVLPNMNTIAAGG